MNIYLIFAFRILLIVAGIVDSKITIENNGYTGILVSISEKVPENQALLSTIKTWLTEGSEKLYNATKQHLYLGKITINIPRHWSHKAEYKLVSASTVSEADIRIGEFSKDTPYVRGSTRCGHEGQYMHMSPTTLLRGNNGNYGNLGIVFTHEWGHLRWGVKDEYAYPSQDQFYLDKTWEPVRCTTELTGSRWNYKDRRRCNLDSTGKPEPDCRFSPDSNSGAIASIMGHAYVKSIYQFCDKNSADPRTLHNTLAPNYQNIHCNKRSAWEVMRAHQDFKTTTPSQSILNTVPEFQLVQIGRKERICLVIDVSGSMESIIKSVRVQLASLVRHTIPNDSYTGIVTFSSGAKALKGLTLITSDNVRNSIVSNLPTTTGGSTSIGAGLQTGLQMLLAHGNGNANGSIIYLASDGQENASPYIDDVLPDLIANGLIVHTIAITGAADSKLKQIAVATGGKSFFYSSSANSTTLADSLAAPFRSVSTDSPLQIKSTHVTLSPGDIARDVFYLDETIGRETVVQFISEVLENVTLSIRHEGSEYTVTGKAEDTGSIAVIIPGIAKKGEYQVNISGVTEGVSGILSVQSKALNNGGDVLDITASTLDTEVNYTQAMKFPIFVYVMKGLEPVTNAFVKAEIENENGKISSIILKDNAVGADEAINDGVYSAYILPTLISGGGRNSIKVFALSRDARVIVSNRISYGLLQTFVLAEQKEESIGMFMRSTISNEIRINNYKPPVPGTDAIPPSAILTLKLGNVKYENHVYTLEWMAVGDDLDTGRASRYDIRMATNYTDLVENPDDQIILPNVPTPKDSGTRETFSFEILNMDSNATYFIVVRAVDDFNNTGEISNVISVSILSDASWQVAPPETNSSNRLYIFILAVAVPVVVIFFASLSLCLYCKRRINKDVPV